MIHDDRVAHAFSTLRALQTSFSRPNKFARWRGSKLRKFRAVACCGNIQKNFPNGLEISSLEPLNTAARLWMDQTANVR
jgi:hypothetical protein